MSPPITCPSAPKKEGTDGRTAAPASKVAHSLLAHCLLRWTVGHRRHLVITKAEQAQRNEATDRAEQPKTLLDAAAPSTSATGRPAHGQRARAAAPQRDRARARPPTRPIPLSVKLFHFLRVTTSTLEAATRSAAPPGAPAGGGRRAGRAGRDALLVECQCGEREEGRGLGRTDGQRRGGRRRAKSYTRRPRKTAEEE